VLIHLSSSRCLSYVTTIVFQQIDIGITDDPATGNTSLEIYGVTEVGRSLSTSTYGVRVNNCFSQGGHSVLAYVHGFLPYFYVAVPRGFQESDLPGFLDHLNVGLVIPVYLCLRKGVLTATRRTKCRGVR
jgi:hypothetical protein